MLKLTIADENISSVYIDPASIVSMKEVEVRLAGYHKALVITLATGDSYTVLDDNREVVNRVMMARRTVEDNT